MFIDSDRMQEDEELDARRTDWQTACEADGGIFHVTRKREIENYLHPDAIQQQCGRSDAYGDFTDMKEKFGPNIIKAVQHMSGDQILERDMYLDNGDAKPALRDAVQLFLNMV